MRVCVRQRQRGMVLIVSLILLALMTLLAVSSSGVVRLEERMAGQQRDSQLAFQAAESALREAEGLLRAGHLGAGDQGYFGPDQSDPLLWQALDWQTQSRPATALAGVAEAPRYIVQSLEPVVLPEDRPTSLVTGYESAQRSLSRFYRITARGVGATPTAVAVLQVWYKWP